MRFKKSELPCYTIWKNPVATEDGYVTGLEPATNFPNPRSFEEGQNRVVKLPPGDKIEFQLELEIHGGEDGVAASEKQIAAIQRGTQPTIYDKPLRGWCADVT